MPRLTTTTSPCLSVLVSPAIVIVTSPSRITMTCSVCSCECSGTCLPGSYVALQRQTCSPPMARRCTPGRNSVAGTSFQLRNGPAPTSDADHVAQRRGLVGHRHHADLPVEDDRLALAVGAVG